jgi:hypothetical protein
VRRLYRPLGNSLDRDTWWDNWAHNFAVSLILWPALAGLAVLVVALVWG